MKTLYFTGLFLMLLIGCSKQVPGPEGEPGKPGRNGNGDLFSTVAFPINAIEWDTAVDNDIFRWKCLKVLDLLNKQAIKSGDITVLMERNQEWFSLPHCSSGIFTQCELKENLLVIYQQHAHNHLIDRPATTNFRVTVLLPQQ